MRRWVSILIFLTERPRKRRRKRRRRRRSQMEQLTSESWWWPRPMEGFPSPSMTSSSPWRSCRHLSFQEQPPLNCSTELLPKCRVSTICHNSSQTASYLEEACVDLKRTKIGSWMKIRNLNGERVKDLMVELSFNMLTIGKHPELIRVDNTSKVMAIQPLE